VNETLLSYFRQVTQEEQAILDGRPDIDRDLYMLGHENTINAKKLLAAGKLITIRPHTRFIHFPEHTHDYVEVVYMCAGHTTHIVNGKKITLQQGDLLLMNQSVTHEVYKADIDDVAVNFIVLPDFFNTTLTTIGDEQTSLRRFLVDCLCGQNTEDGYLHFSVSHIQVVQNLAENLLWQLLDDSSNKRNIIQMTMALLFLNLISHTDSLHEHTQENAMIFRVLEYVESNYIDGSFTELAKKLHYDPSWLSREIKRKTGKTFTQLIQEKRLAQAAFLLKNTDRNVSDISLAVGYENASYFYRIFENKYGKSPRHYRVQERTLF